MNSQNIRSYDNFLSRAEFRDRSIGANIEEAIGGQSKKDFFAKLTISYKEARESKFWIRLLKDTDYLSKDEAESLLQDIEELLKIIGSIQKTIKNQL